MRKENVMSDYETRLKRLNDAIALKEPDQVPNITQGQCFPILDAGHTMKDALYNFDILEDSLVKFAQKYQPDSLMCINATLCGMGPAYELMGIKNLHWAGMKDSPISDKSCHQYIEYPILEDDEFPEFMTDYLSWFLEKGMPRNFGAVEPFSKMGLTTIMPMYLGFQALPMAFSSPEAREMIETFWKVADLMKDIDQKNFAMIGKLAELGFPAQALGFGYVPFDAYSDMMRGTILSLQDLYDHEDAVLQYNAKFLNEMKAGIAAQGQVLKGKWVFVPLHKGMDRFLSDEQYRKFYWNDLREVIECIIDNGMTPYIFTEGPYNSRLECLKEVPKGKVIYHFEECDMARAKKELGDIACISGNFPVTMLQFGTVAQVRDEVKRLLDICAPGGGYMFDTSCALDEAKRENVEAMMEAVSLYGKK